MYRYLFSIIHQRNWPITTHFSQNQFPIPIAISFVRLQSVQRMRSEHIMSTLFPKRNESAQCVGKQIINTYTPPHTYIYVHIVIVEVCLFVCMCKFYCLKSALMEIPLWIHQLNAITRWQFVYIQIKNGVSNDGTG